MTKVYEGGGIYTISLGCSGKTIELTEDELNEIIEEEIDGIKAVKETIDKAVDLLEDILDERE